MNWTAEITNNPQDDFEPYIELLENDEFRGRVERRNGTLVLVLYGADAAVPVNWLVGILNRAAEDLGQCDPPVSSK